MLIIVTRLTLFDFLEFITPFTTIMMHIYKNNIILKPARHFAERAHVVFNIIQPLLHAKHRRHRLILINTFNRLGKHRRYR